MGKPHPIEWRGRVVAFVGEGNSNRRRRGIFRVSPRFVNNLMKLKAETGSLERAGKVTGSTAASLPRTRPVRRRMEENGDLTLDELCIEMEGRGITVHRFHSGDMGYTFGPLHGEQGCLGRSVAKWMSG